MKRPFLLMAIVVLAGLAILVWFLTRPDAAVEPVAAKEPKAKPVAESPAAPEALQTLRTRARELDAGVAVEPAHGQAKNVVAKFGWGSGPDQLGRNRPENGNPEGPMSLAVAPGGEVVVLDQVNERLLKLDKNGKMLSSTPLPVRGAQDVAVAKDGTALVLDRSLDKSVALVGPDGKVTGTLAVEGGGIPEGGAVTGVFSDGKDVYVEREHADQVKIGTTSGQAAATRDEVPGRLSKDGTVYLTAGISQPGAPGVYLMAIEAQSRQPRFSQQYQLAAPVLALTLLDTDRSGIIYLAALLEPAEGAQAMMSLMCLDPLDGRPLGVTQIPASSDADETFRELTVGEEGGVLYLYRSEQGAELQRYDCR